MELVLTIMMVNGKLLLTPAKEIKMVNPAHYSQRDAVGIVAAKLAEIQNLIDECIGLAEYHNIEMSFEVGRTTIQRSAYGSVEAWESSEDTWQESNWADSSC